jgi:hypothetical protein
MSKLRRKSTDFDMTFHSLFDGPRKAGRGAKVEDIHFQRELLAGTESLSIEGRGP